jgi:hypothetical protein
MLRRSKAIILKKTNEQKPCLNKFINLSLTLTQPGV